MNREIVFSQKKTAGSSGVVSTVKALQKELERIAGLKRVPESVTVLCGEETLTLEAPVVLKKYPFALTFQAKTEGKSVFSRGIVLSGPEKAVLNGKDVFVFDVPEEGITENTVPQFFVNGKRKVNARYPKGIDGLPADMQKVQAEDRLHFPLQEKLPEKFFRSGSYGLVIHLWNETRTAIRSYDAETSTVSFSTPVIWPLKASFRFFLLNCRESLSEPGEYWFDPEAKKIWYLPEKGEKVSNVQAVIPGNGPAVLVNGGLSEKSCAGNITFSGIVFRYAGGHRPGFDKFYDFGIQGLPKMRNGFIGKRTEWKIRSDSAQQAEIHLPGIFHAQGADGLIIENCTFEHCSWNGIHLGYGCRNVKIRNSVFTDLGGGGIYLSGPVLCDSTSGEEVLNVEITNNLITDCGKYYLSAVGINAGHVLGVLMEHNEISHLYYSGISGGWNWGYGRSAAGEMRIGYNHIHHLGKGVLCDMGCIYLLGIQPGTRVYNNVVHDVQCRFYGGWGIYTDEGSSHIVIEKNVCYDCSCEPFHQHYGRENILRDNIFAFGARHGINFSRGHDKQTGYSWPGENYKNILSFLRNVIVVDNVPLIKIVTEEVALNNELFSDMNVFWDVSGREQQAFARSNKNPSLFPLFADWKKQGFDRFSLFADPGFVSLEKRDFHLKADSILRKNGFADPAETLEQAGRKVR